MKKLITTLKQRDPLEQLTLGIMFAFIFAPVWLFIQFETPWWLCFGIMVLAAINFRSCWRERL